jgi:hypothetical protein
VCCSCGDLRFVKAPGTSTWPFARPGAGRGTGRRRWNAQTMPVRDPGAPEARGACREGSAAGAARTRTCTCWPRRATRCDLGIKTNRRRNTASCTAGPAAFGAAGCRAPLALCRWGCVGAPAFACTTCWPGAHVTLASSPSTAAGPLTAAIIAAILSRHQCRRQPAAASIGPGLQLHGRAPAAWARL